MCFTTPSSMIYTHPNTPDLGHQTVVEAKAVDNDGDFLSLTAAMSRRLSELTRLDEERGAELVFIHRVSPEARIPTESPPTVTGFVTTWRDSVCSWSLQSSKEDG